MQYLSEKYKTEIFNESISRNSTLENSLHYSKEYLLDEEYLNSPCYGITVKSRDGSISSCIVLASGGSTTVHENSAKVIDKCLFLAIGNLICCFELSSLTLKWHKQVDMSTCFGVFTTQDMKSLISYGEMDIAKLNLTGDIIWTVSGKDIFTGGFTLLPDHIEVIDFNQEKYHIALSNGQISLQ